MLRVTALEKSYGDVEALRGVDLDVPAGDIVCLLGPNGAGKTTLISIVAGLRRADAGQVRVGDVDPVARPRAARRLLGLAPQETGVYPVVTVRDNLVLFGELAGLRRQALRERIEAVAEALDLTSLLDRVAGTLSGGQKRRVHTALALLHEPALLLLDEATVGADVETRAELLDLVRRLADDGAAVLYSTHYLNEVETLDAQVAIIDEGRVIARGPVRELLAEHAQTAVEARFAGPVPARVHEVGEVRNGAVRIPTREPVSTIRSLLRTLGDGAATIDSLEIVRPNLESVYLALTGRRFAEAHADAMRREVDDGVAGS